MVRRLRHGVLLFLVCSLGLSPTLLRADEYPKFQIKGFQKYEYLNQAVTPIGNTFLAQTYLGALPQTIGFTSPWQTRLRLQLAAQLSPDLNVAYDIEQEPELPQKSDVVVGYGPHKLTFGDFTADIKGNEFAAAQKFLNGVMITSKTDRAEVTVIPSAKLRSNTQALQTQRGNNTAGPYNLGRGSIVEGSERIEVNQVPLRRGVDYTIDYFEGRITFLRILAPTDEFRYTYEFTNVVDLFFPTISRRDFFGVQAKGLIDSTLFTKPTVPKIQAVTRAFEETFPKSAFVPDVPRESTQESTTVPLEDFLPTFPRVRTDIPGYGVGVSPGRLEGATASPEASTQSIPLAGAPIVTFSEVVEYGGKVLKKGDDYEMDYARGFLFLTAGIKPSDKRPIRIRYSSFETATAGQRFSGQGQKGPYPLAQKNIVPGTESVRVDGVLLTPDLDYELSPLVGTIVFSVPVGTASEIDIGYKFIQTVAPKVITEKPLYAVGVGATYLRESSKGGTPGTTTTVQETYAGTSVSSSLLNLNNYPLDSASPLTVTINGTAQTAGVDFIVPTSEAATLELRALTDNQDKSDGYATGTLFFKKTIQAADQIAVTYTFKKSVIGTYNGTGNGSQGPYYLTNVYAMVPGSERIQVWDTGSSVISGMVRNSKKTLNDGDYKINYDHPFTPYITFNNPFPVGKNFRVTYNYITTSRVEERAQSHDVTGATVDVDIAGRVKLRSDVALSQVNQVVSAQSASETRTGTNSRGPYPLSNNNVIEGTERVFVDGRLVNKDIDYFINYTAGQITFFYLTLTPANTLFVEYQFQTTGGVTTVGQTKQGTAINLQGETKIGEISVASRLRDVGSTFTPIGITEVAAGSRRLDTLVGYTPNEYIGIKSQIIESRSQIGTFTGVNIYSRDHVSTLTYNPAKVAFITLTHRDLRTFDDLLPGATAHTQDITLNSFQTTVGFKPFPLWRWNVKNENRFQSTRSRDNALAALTNLLSYGSRVDFEWDKLATWGLDYQYSEPITAMPTGEALHSVARDVTTHVAWDFTQAPFQKLAARARFVTHDENNVITNTPLFTKNSFYHVDIVPWFPVTAGVDHNRQESRAIRIGGINPSTSRTELQVAWVPGAAVAVDTNIAADDFFQENGSRGSGTENRLSVRYAPIQTLAFNSRLGYRKRTFVTVADTSVVQTDTTAIAQDYGATYTPASFLQVSGGFGIEDFKNFSAAGNVNTHARNLTRRLGASTTLPGDVTLGAIYSLKTTLNVFTGTDTPKELWQANIAYPLFGPGKLVYEWETERNQGEVLGGVLTPLNIHRTTNSLKYEVSYPQVNPLIGSFDVRASYRHVGYQDNANAANTFGGTQFTVEGTLNFR